MGKVRNELVDALVGPGAGAYAYPSSITLDAQGRVTAVGADWTQAGVVMSTATGSITLGNIAGALRSGNYALRLASGLTATGGVDTNIILDTTNAMATADKLVSVQTATVEKLYIDGNGNIFDNQANFSLYNNNTDGFLFSGGAVYGRVGNVTLTQLLAGLYAPFTDFGLTNGTSAARWSATFSRHFHGGSAAAPTGVLGTGANVGAGSGHTITGNDASGKIQVVTGNGVQNVTATVITITFNTSYGTAPSGVQLTPANDAAAALYAANANPFVSATAAGTFTVTSRTAVALGTSATYEWWYEVIA